MQIGVYVYYEGSALIYCLWKESRIRASSANERTIALGERNEDWQVKMIRIVICAWREKLQPLKRQMSIR
jgi:hypothetical protein